jgi:hypothetical protein
MAKKSKHKNRSVSELAKKNPRVDENVVADSLVLIEHLRKIGIKPKGFNILRVSESKLKVRTPVYLSKANS